MTSGLMLINEPENTSARDVDKDRDAIADGMND
jgi:hypothetical protein